MTYRVVHHKKLSGRGVGDFAVDHGVGSTNLFYDVYGHIENAHLNQYVKSGIYGYNCRYISGTTKWSTHAWGIAVDQNSAYEHVGSAHIHTHSINSSVATIWQDHNWYWGKAFGDAMHFQYATGY